MERDPAVLGRAVSRPLALHVSSLAAAAHAAVDEDGADRSGGLLAHCEGERGRQGGRGEEGRGAIVKGHAKTEKEE